VSTQRLWERASCEARQSDGCKDSGAADMESEQLIMDDAKKYCMFIQYYSLQVLASFIFWNAAVKSSPDE
jgi:hypothetical protein